MSAPPLIAPLEPAEDTAPLVSGALRPSEYTATLVQVLAARPDWVRGARVLEIGSGSGVVLAALGSLGAGSLSGVDIEPEAVASSALLLARSGYRDIMDLYQGDMWAPFAGRQYDLIAANLPHFPMDPHAYADRLPSWSSGGANGRRLLDRFLLGLGEHLGPHGRAVITHNGFVDVEKSREIVGLDGLSLRILRTVWLHIPAEKLALMSPDILEAEDGRTIHRYGPYAFGEMHIVEIGDATTLV